MTRSRASFALAAVLTVLALAWVAFGRAGSSPEAEAGPLLPDFVVDSITTLPESPEAGEQVGVTVEAHNQGGPCSADFDCDGWFVDFYMDSETEPPPGPPSDVDCFYFPADPPDTQVCVGAVTYPAPGTFKMWARVEASGEVLEPTGNNLFGPQEIIVVGATPTPTPIATATPTAAPSPTPTSTPTATPTQSPAPSLTPTPTASPTPTPTATPTPTPSQSPAPSPTAPPTATPTPSPSAFGDVDCSGGINSIDALKVLRTSASLLSSQTEPCADIGVETLPNGRLQGDVNCSGGVNSVDALLLLRFSAALIVNQPDGCPEIGS